MLAINLILIELSQCVRCRHTASFASSSLLCENSSAGTVTSLARRITSRLDSSEHAELDEAVSRRTKMKRKSHALGSSDPASGKSARGRQPLQLLTAEQRSRLPYTLPKDSSAGADDPSTVCREECRPSVGSIASVSELAAQNEGLSPRDRQKSLSSPNSIEEPSNDEPEQRVPFSLWASSIVDMVQCDPLFPTKPVSIATSRSGAVTALLLKKGFLRQSARPDVLVAALDNFMRLQTASAAGSSLRAYYIFDGLGTECRVLDDSLAVVKVTYLGACSINSIEHIDTATHVRVSLTLIHGKRSVPESSSPSDFSLLRKVDHSFLGFRCRVCGRANRKDSLKKVNCLHCATAFTITDEQAPTLLPQSRKMELRFTGCSSDLGQANILLAENAITQRSVSTFSDGVRIDATAFPTTSRCFGVVSLSESTVVSIKSTNPNDTAAVAKGRQQKESSLGSFVMQPREALVARNDLLQSVEMMVKAALRFVAIEDPRSAMSSGCMNHKATRSDGKRPNSIEFLIRGNSSLKGLNRLSRSGEYQARQTARSVQIKSVHEI
ncbi:RTA1-like protein [Pseudozyma hubeiensis SY62]|uniref:RTA1-like protein n=1 Tax=Pseudozyma hubeiensis (strain SY62) TaxID=1305764 RepID=R9PCW9_PSEHS|nr:RTA1-like protein [Pseudozyma hubeiensis SY62]GAC95910.1 RTA1-like protein [Pseudozyma hubeiensis SY62]